MGEGFCINTSRFNCWYQSDLRCSCLVQISIEKSRKYIHKIFDVQKAFYFSLSSIPHTGREKLIFIFVAKFFVCYNSLYRQFLAQKGTIYFTFPKVFLFSVWIILYESLTQSLHVAILLDIQHWFINAWLGWLIRVFLFHVYHNAELWSESVVLFCFDLGCWVFFLNFFVSVPFLFLICRYT